MCRDRLATYKQRFNAEKRLLDYYKTYKKSFKDNKAFEKFF